MTKRLGTFIKGTSRNPVIQSFQFIKENYFPYDKLFDENSDLQKDAIDAIDKHNDENDLLFLDKREVGAYITASTLSHVLDGWGYLANSLNSLSNGNEGVAIHLAYYAELRAVMSFLASEGIGVFDRTHIGLGEDGNFNIFHRWKRKNPETGRTDRGPVSTHVFAWEALNKWCSSTVKPSFNILDVFKVKGQSFSDLTQGFHPAATPVASTEVAKKWLRNWAFDVKKYKRDRDLRNMVSYRPQTMVGFEKRLDFQQTLKKIYYLFRFISPQGSDKFHFLDILLLKELFEDLHRTNPAIAGTDFQQCVENAFQNTGANLDNITKTLILSGTPNRQEHLIFQEAAKKETLPLPIISRSVFLLRVATGFVSQLLQEANINKQELNFIWESYGFNCGFWETPVPVSNFADLWSEVEQDYADLEDEFDNLSNCSHSVKEEFGNAIGKLTQFNRAALWGI